MNHRSSITISLVGRFCNSFAFVNFFFYLLQNNILRHQVKKIIVKVHTALRQFIQIWLKRPDEKRWRCEENKANFLQQRTCSIFFIKVFFSLKAKKQYNYIHTHTHTGPSWNKISVFIFGISIVRFSEIQSGKRKLLFFYFECLDNAMLIMYFFKNLRLLSEIWPWSQVF